MKIPILMGYSVLTPLFSKQKKKRERERRKRLQERESGCKRERERAREREIVAMKRSRSPIRYIGNFKQKDLVRDLVSLPDRPLVGSEGEDDAEKKRQQERTKLVAEDVVGSLPHHENVSPHEFLSLSLSCARARLISSSLQYDCTLSECRSSLCFSFLSFEQNNLKTETIFSFGIFCLLFRV